MPKRKTTRNAQGGGTIRQRKDGRWEARYTVGRDPGTGRQIQKSVYAATQGEVRKKLAQATAAIDEGIYQEPSKLTVGAWLDIWLKEYTGNVKQRTLEQYGGKIEYRIKPAIGSIKLTALKTPQIQAFYNDSLKDSKDRKAISPKTIKDLHGVLHKALKQAVEIGYLRNNPADACKLPRVEKAKISPLEEDQITAFLNEIKGHPHEVLYTISLFSGLRQGEILGLSWDSVDFNNGTILIKQQLQRIKGEYQILSVKNDKTRKIMPAPFIMDLLRIQKRQQAKWRLRAGIAWNNTFNLVFTDELGKYISRETIYSNYKRIAKKLGFGEKRFHDLRHTYAVVALQSGDDVKTVQENLGHHTAAFTLDVYGHVSERMKRESSERMEDFIKSVKNL